MSVLSVSLTLVAGICITLALVYATIWLRLRHSLEYLFFSIASAGLAGNAFVELWMYQRNSVEAFAFALRLENLFVCIVLLGVVWVIAVTFHTARRSLAIAASIGWGLSLIVNFLSPYSIVYSNISQIQSISFVGETVHVAAGTSHTLKWLPDVATFLILVFVVDASIRLWRRGGRRKSILIGGSVIISLILGWAQAVLVDLQLLTQPYLITYAFLIFILAMGLELSNDVVRAASLSREVASNERRWRSLLENVQLLVVGLDQRNCVNYVNPYFLTLTGYAGEEVMGKDWSHFFPDGESNTDSEDTERRQPYHESLIVTKGKNQRRIAWSRVAIYGQDSELSGSIRVGADVTDREAAYREIQQLKDRLEEENLYLQEEIILDHNHRNIIGRSSALKYALARVEQVASADTTVLIQGETGVGKELFARAVHNASPRKARPLVKVNCASIPSNLIESEIFGHEKGAFTGADRMMKGRFELAHGGTLFLDEIGELPLEVQPKLLRVLEDGEFERLGSSQTMRVDVRVIAATNRVLRNEVEAGRFREDLFYRLSVFPITIPPLRKRKDDILPLVQSFVENFARKQGKAIDTISKETIETLSKYPWPGNVRELRNIVERAVLTCRSTKLEIAEGLETMVGPVSNQVDSWKSLEEMEREYITDILKECNWRVEGEKGAARILDMHPNTLRHRIRKLGIQRPS